MVNNTPRDKEMQSLMAKIRNLQLEARTTPKVGPARVDPPPVSDSKTHYINRRIVVTKTTNASSIAVTVDDIKAQSSTASFKILKLSAWIPGNVGTGRFVLSNSVWENPTSTALSYTDTAPLSRMPSVKFDIPDQMALPLNTGADTVITMTSIGTAAVNSIIVVVEATICYQI
jgi:hypothetical protein